MTNLAEQLLKFRTDAIALVLAKHYPTGRINLSIVEERLVKGESVEAVYNSLAERLRAVKPTVSSPEEGDRRDNVPEVILPPADWSRGAGPINKHKQGGTARPKIKFRILAVLKQVVEWFNWKQTS